MRKKPNLHGIDSIYIIPKSCDNCKRPLFNGDETVVELDKHICYCLECGGDESLEPIEGEWVSHTYSNNEEYNTFYNVRDIRLFENMIGEKVV